MSNNHANEIIEQGYTIIPDILDASLLTAARTALQQVFDDEREMAKAKNWQNNINQVSYLLPQKHEIFRSLGLNPRLLPIVQEILGNNCNLSNVNGLTMIPGGQTQNLHMDAFESTPST